MAPPLRLISVGRRRVDALKALLRDVADAPAGSGEARPGTLTITVTLGAVEGRLGALPGMLSTTRLPAPLRSETLQRLGCFSDLDVLLLDAAGNPVGASSTRRSASRRERRAVRAQWGPTCAVRGCTSTSTVPHHVVPWWLSRRTRLRDLLPLCEHCHRDLHEDHRRLRVRDGRYIDEHGWAAPAP